jgi:hypothetical protein
MNPTFHSDTSLIMKSLSTLLLLSLLNSCADRPIVYVGTQLGLHAQGVKDGYPNKVSVGYDRQELAWLPDANRSDLVGGFDGEVSGINGIAVAEVLATGEAAAGEPSEADVASDVSSPAKYAPFTKTLIVSTTTKFNLGIEAASSDGASPSLNAGLKRSVLALFPALDGNSGENIPSTYSDITVHASGFRGAHENPKGIPNEKRRLTTGKGVRVVQTIATGKAATLVCEKEGKQLIEGVIGEIGKKD